MSHGGCPRKMSPENNGAGAIGMPQLLVIPCAANIWSSLIAHCFGPMQGLPMCCWRDCERCALVVALTAVMHKMKARLAHQDYCVLVPWWMSLNAFCMPLAIDGIVASWWSWWWMSVSLAALAWWSTQPHQNTKGSGTNTGARPLTTQAIVTMSLSCWVLAARLQQLGVPSLNACQVSIKLTLLWPLQELCCL